jgi:hypothetical protein
MASVATTSLVCSSFTINLSLIGRCDEKSSALSRLIDREIFPTALHRVRSL